MEIILTSISVVLAVVIVFLLIRLRHQGSLPSRTRDSKIKADLDEERSEIVRLEERILDK